ncbi:10883_t:CDS:2 [Ambispora leptoticha]|uniref:10883_t:CDS:1 n=1 Tax=Ambispora leptoticha TaxID=144679 RepID=A0A9N9FRL5_9GLOM|nr:10883_t:CDS:2 [Ambispora leptoticha]
MAAVFAMQGFASIFVAVITLDAAKNDIYGHKNVHSKTPRYRIEVEQYRGDLNELPRSS